jgi:hypothetical protein
MLAALSRPDIDSPSHDPELWLVTDGRRSVEVSAQTWFGARMVGAAKLGVDTADVRARKVTELSEAERVDASFGRTA